MLQAMCPPVSPLSALVPTPRQQEDRVLQSLRRQPNTKAAASTEHLSAVMPRLSATAVTDASARAAASASHGPHLTVPIKSEPCSVPFDLMGPSLMPSGQPDSAHLSTPPQSRSTPSVQQTNSSRVLSQPARQFMVEHIVVASLNSRGLAAEQELARAAMNGTLCELVTSELSQYPRLTGEHADGPTFTPSQSLTPDAGLSPSTTVSPPGNTARPEFFLRRPSYRPQPIPQPGGHQSPWHHPSVLQDHAQLLRPQPYPQAEDVLSFGATHGPQLTDQQHGSGVRPTLQLASAPKVGAGRFAVPEPLSEGARCPGHNALGTAHANSGPTQRSLTPAAPTHDPNFRTAPPHPNQLVETPILLFRKGPRIKTTIRTTAAGPTAEAAVQMIGSRRAVPIPDSPGADVPSSRASSLNPTTLSPLPRVPPSCPSPDASISGTTESTVSVDFAAVSEVLGAADAPVNSNIAAADHGAHGQRQHNHQTGITAQACQQPAAQLHCSESLDTPSPPPSSPAQALVDSAADLPPDVAAAAEEGNEEWVPDGDAMLAASALAGMAESQWEQGKILFSLDVCTLRALRGSSTHPVECA